MQGDILYTDNVTYDIVTPSKFIKGIKGWKTAAVDIETSEAFDYPRKGWRKPKPGIFPPWSKVELIQISNGTKTYVSKFDTKILTALETIPNLIAHNSKFETSHFFYNSRIKFDMVCTAMLVELLDDAFYTESAFGYLRKKVKQGKLIHAPGPSLASACERYLNIVMDKSEQVSDWSGNITSSQYDYAASDAYWTFKLATKLSKLVKKLRLKKVLQLHSKMQMTAGLMEMRGFGINKDLHEGNYLIWEKARSKLEKKLEKPLKGCSPTSTKQLAKWLEEEHPELVPEFPKTEKGNLQFTKEVCLHYSHIPALKLLGEKKKYDKAVNTYGRKLAQAAIPHKDCDRIHSNFRIGGTTTGRMSSSNPNLQNMTRDDTLPGDTSLRKCFIPRPGYVFVAADYSQIEIRVAAAVSKDQFMYDCYEQGIDLHKMIVAKLLDEAIESISKLQRQLGKAVNFGLLYGMWWKKLQIYAKDSYGVEMDIDDAKRFYELFHALYWEYSAWCERERSKVMDSRLAVTPLGKIRRLTEDQVYTCAVNTPVQGGAAEVVQLASCYCEAELPKKAYLVNVVHDELILEVKEGKEKKAASILEDCMYNAFLKIFPDGPTRNLVEVNTGYNWLEVK